jgi:hypothetical protein
MLESLKLMRLRRQSAADHHVLSAVRRQSVDPVRARDIHTSGVANWTAAARFRLRWIAAVMAVIALAVEASAQQVSYSGDEVTGTLSLLRVVNLRQQAQQLRVQALGAASKEVLHPLPPRLVPPGGSLLPAAMAKALPPLRTANVLATAPAVNGLSIATLPGTFGFNALSHRDQRLAFNGNQLNIEPPNPSIAVGNGYVLEGVNNAVQVYTTAGTPLLASAVASNQVFGLAPVINRATIIYGVYLTDMRVYYDQGMNRWLIIQRSQDEDTAGNYLVTSHLYIAVSQTPDPTANYNIYWMDTSNGGHSGCPCIADYPQIGSDQYGFHIAWNEFAYSPSFGYYSYVDAAVLSLSKASLTAGAAFPTAVQFLLPFISGFEFSLQPATTPAGASNFLASGGVEFLVSTASPSGNAVGLWALCNTSSLSTSKPSLFLVRNTVPTLAYSTPPNAHQLPGPTPYGSSLIPPEPLEFIDGGDVRVQAASYASGRLYLTFGTGAFDENGKYVVGAAYVVLSPTYRAGVLAGLVLNQGRLWVRGNDLLRPAIAVNAQGNGAIAVTLTGVDWHPSAAAIPFRGSSTPSSIQVAAAGVLPEDGFSGYSPYGGYGLARWGDYSTAVAAGDGNIWMVAEYIGQYPTYGLANWNTFVYRRPPG